MGIFRNVLDAISSSRSDNDYLDDTCTCSECGKDYTEDEAMDEFEDYIGTSITYFELFDIDYFEDKMPLCGECAGRLYDAWYDDYSGSEYEDLRPQCCAACGNDAFPNCKSGCNMYDD